MNITIVGGGNIGTQFAVLCAEKKHNVIIFSSKPECFTEDLFIVNDNGSVTNSGTIVLATNNENLAFSKPDIIFITLPAFCMSDIAQKILPYAKKGLYIGLIPGTGGGECAFRRCIDDVGCTVFGIQRVPSVSRLIQYGKVVRASGYRPHLHLAAIPHSQTDICCSIVSETLGIPCIGTPNYLNITLTPSNSILHTTRLYTLFKDYKKGVSYNRDPLFYEEWDDNASQLLFLCDEELQKICTSLTELDLSFVKSLKQHYESNTIEKLTKKIKSIKSLQGLETPMIKSKDGWIPDFSSRYFTADFPFGLQIICQIASFISLDVPNMNKILHWYDSVSLNKDTFDYRFFGINNYSEFLSFYSL